MIDTNLHIITFNIPYPANYGGVIDVFYRLKALSENSVKITLHCFEYGREHRPELEQYCEKVYYYKRDTRWIKQLSALPYIVYSRRHPELLENLLKDDSPILFEGLHTTYYLDHPALANRLKLVRAHNVEHLYYSGLARNTRSLYKKMFFTLEASRLKRYEPVLEKADYILALSTLELAHFETEYGKDKAVYVPLFTKTPGERTDRVKIKPFVLYHGDLSTPENQNAVEYLLREVVPINEEIPWVFAGLNPS
ncbi:glycosyltransferase family 1 protein, partial [Bacteroidales bacterium OttesenSCG-928-L03]|nr:glycosyltransferase family 1 protein [Bacteroidales bacterium OttesenSCG-928-L03]